MKYQVLFSLKNKEKVFINAVLAEDSHEISSLIFSEKQRKSIYKCCLLHS